MACLSQAVELVRPLAVETYVLHLWGTTTTQIIDLIESPNQRQVILGAIMAQAERSLAQLCDLLDPTILCVENLEEPSFDLFLPLIERFGTGICLDVGHLAWQETSELDFLASHGDRVREIHLHDANHTSAGDLVQIRDHLPLGRGELDFTSLLQKLDETKFTGAVILEVNTKADLEQSLERLHALSRQSWKMKDPHH
jgi:sugar phosphate isomerase/epimerase